MVDPENDRLRRKLADMGVRRKPALPFLPRGHIVNRLLGRIQARVGSPLRAAAPAQGA